MGGGRPPARTSGMHDMTYGDKRTPQEIHDDGDCKGHPCCAACRRALLGEDHEPIKPVKDAIRKAWEKKPTGYTREQYERDKHAREQRDA